MNFNTLSALYVIVRSFQVKFTRLGGIEATLLYSIDGVFWNNIFFTFILQILMIQQMFPKSLG